MLLALALLFVGKPAHAYPFMIRHTYADCSECHADPSGGGILKEYGRGQSEILLATPWKARSEDWEPGPSKDFLFGALPLPDNVLLGATYRDIALLTVSSGTKVPPRFIIMQADLRSQLTLGRFRANASIGVAPVGAYPVSITSRPDWNLVSREHWVGMDVSDSVLIRAGRMMIPFGIRTEEHELWARNITETDLKEDQQYGVSAFFGSGDWRAEVMGIAGNFTVSPDAFRQRGGSAYIERGISSTSAVGVSGLVTHSMLDPLILVERTRSATGAFGRWAPVKPVVLMAEADFLTDHTSVPTPGGYATGLGSVGFFKLDLEPIQGLHFQGTGEWWKPTGTGMSAVPGTGEWLSAVWFVVPHADIRFDGVHRELPVGLTTVPVNMGIAQFHLSL